MKRSALLSVSSVFGLLLAASQSVNSAASLRHRPAASIPNINQPMLPFALMGADNKKHALAEFQGHPITVFFLCGCDWCTRCAKTWAQFQRSDALHSERNVHSVPAAAESINTLIVFAGDASAARSFAAQTGLRPEQTLMLCDTTMRVTNAYHVESCPRVFVTDATGKLRYTNNHQDDRPHTSTPLTIVCRALSAMHTAQDTKDSQ